MVENFVRGPLFCPLFLGIRCGIPPRQTYEINAVRWSQVADYKNSPNRGIRRGRPLTSQTAFGGQLPYKGSLVRPVARFHHIPFEYNGRLLRATSICHGIGYSHKSRRYALWAYPTNAACGAVRPLFYFLFPAEEDFDGQGGEPDVAGQDIDDAVPAGFSQVVVAPYHVGKVDGDEEQGDEARGDGVFQGLRSALRGQVLEPDDEADGQDAEQAEVEIAFAADFAFEV